MIGEALKAFTETSALPDRAINAGEIQTLSILEDTVQYLDDVFSRLGRYTRFCEERPVEPVELRF